MTEYNTYDLIDYFDVWGNEEDGWEVNNQCKVDEITISDDVTDEEILKYLKDIGYLKLDASCYEIVGEQEMMDILSVVDGYPLYSLRMQIK